jgi:hypothetical protein
MDVSESLNTCDLLSARSTGTEGAGALFYGTTGERKPTFGMEPAVMQLQGRTCDADGDECDNERERELKHTCKCI